MNCYNNETTNYYLKQHLQKKQYLQKKQILEKKHSFNTDDKQTKPIIVHAQQYKLTTNNFNPEKFSPNLFLTKLEFRMKHYHIEEALLKDPLTL